MENISFIPALIGILLIIPHTSSCMSRMHFKNYRFSLKQFAPLALITLSQLPMKTLYAQGEKLDLNEKTCIQLSNFDRIILERMINEKAKEFATKAGIIQNTDTQNSSAMTSYVVKSPTPLTIEELDLPILERIGKKYIGELPEKIKDVIAQFSFTRNIQGKGMSNAILLHGDPGDGKSFLVETLSQELQVDYLYCDAGAFINKYAGESSKNIVKFFETAKNNKNPVFVFIDEVDALATTRDGRPGEYRAALTTLLIQVQSLAYNPHVFIFIATNTPYDLDPALQSRFKSRSVKIDKIERKEEYIAFFTKSLKDQGFNSEDDIKKITSDIYAELNGWIFKTKFSRRDLAALIPNALARKHTWESLHKDSQNDLLFYVKQIIKETKKGIEQMQERPHSSKPQ